ncbi:MAG: YlbF family regulator [Blautia sp.]|nr:YlbF family regulator [Blautia sp.]
MDNIQESVDLLIQQIRESEIGQRYLEQEEKLSIDPELKERVDQFRRLNFNLQRSSEQDSLLEASEQLVMESRELRMNPQVNAYLDAELALCKLIQKICMRLTNETGIRTPDL